ncbi:364_t:CDS:2 [Funneliformis caledonium]|uniref:364_t:CDS:1 n=1 Tax=Funneliformis caledonium TaxID=1117310 RepID=A0A9N9DL72_9GLOM|nr:364_t:CDS:2 [Funneliformis caledonium]
MEKTLEKDKYTSEDVYITDENDRNKYNEKQELKKYCHSHSVTPSDNYSSRSSLTDSSDYSNSNHNQYASKKAPSNAPRWAFTRYNGPIKEVIKKACRQRSAISLDHQEEK